MTTGGCQLSSWQEKPGRLLPLKRFIIEDELYEGGGLEAILDHPRLFFNGLDSCFWRNIMIISKENTAYGAISEASLA